MAQADYYLKIEGIDGEAEAEGLKNQIQIESWSWGATNSGSAAQGTGMGMGKVSLQDFHFVCQNGKATPQLFLACAKGEHKGNATLTCRRSGGDGTPQTYYEMIFDDIVISSFQEGGSGGSDLLPMCQISFNYAKITQKYYRQDTKTGKNTLTNTVSYDIKKTKGEGA